MEAGEEVLSREAGEVFQYARQKLQAKSANAYFIRGLQIYNLKKLSRLNI